MGQRELLGHAVAAACCAWRLLPPPEQQPALTLPCAPPPPCCAGTGRAKKSGAGGKYTWGSVYADGGEDGASPVLDPNDPNYDSGALRCACCALHRALPAQCTAPRALPCFPPTLCAL